MAAAPEQPQSLAAYTKSVLSGDTLILRGKVVQNNALPRSVCHLYSATGGRRSRRAGSAKLPFPSPQLETPRRAPPPYPPTICIVPPPLALQSSELRLTRIKPQGKGSPPCRPERAPSRFARTRRRTVGVRVARLSPLPRRRQGSLLLRQLHRPECQRPPRVWRRLRPCRERPRCRDRCRRRTRPRRLGQGPRQRQARPGERRRRRLGCDRLPPRVPPRPRGGRPSRRPRPLDPRRPAAAPRQLHHA